MLSLACRRAEMNYRFVPRRIAFNENTGTKIFFDVLSKNVQIFLVKKD